MIDYLGSLPMWLQIVIILVTLILVLGLIAAVIYKIVTADRIKAGPMEIEDDPDNIPDKLPARKKKRVEP